MENVALRALADSIPDSMFTKEFRDGSFYFTFVNKAKAANSEVEPEVMIGKKDSDFMPQREAEIAFEDDMRAYNGENIDRIERRIRPDGSVVFVSVTKSQLKDSEGNVIGISGIAKDITRRIEIEQLMQLELQVIIHDLGNTLVGHGGFMEYMISLLQKGKYEKCLNLLPSRIEECLLYKERIQALNLKLSQMGLEKPELPRTETLFDLRTDVFDKILLKHGYTIQTMGIKLDDFMGLIPEGKFILSTVKEWLLYSLDQPFHNQLKYGETIKRITFGAEIDSQQQHLIINVSSDGLKINEEFARTKLFKKGQRANETSHKEGTGFGLYTAREYIRELGGEMLYVPVVSGEHSEWMGFTIVLPLSVLDPSSSVAIN